MSRIHKIEGPANRPTYHPLAMRPGIGPVEREPVTWLSVLSRDPRGAIGGVIFGFAVVALFFIAYIMGGR